MEPPLKRQKVSRIEARNIYYQNQRKNQQPRYASVSIPIKSSRELSIRAPVNLFRRPRNMAHEIRTTDRRRQVDLNVDTPVVDVDVVVNLPSVPAVPQFASDFAPPAYPSVAPVTLPVVPSVVPYPFATQSPTAATPSPANSTRPADVTGSSSEATSTPTQTAEPSSQAASSDPSGSSTSTAESVAVSGSSTAESSVTDMSISMTGSTTFGISTASFSATRTGVGAPIGGTAVGDPGAAASSAAADSSGGQSSADDGPSTPAVVGGVVGGVAGLVVFLGLLLMLLRWYRQRERGGALQLGDGDAAETGPRAISEKGNLIPPAASALLGRYRFSAASKETDISSGTGERSFQRVSGRKLPSVFSPGMTSDDIQPGTSYRDSQDTYLGSTAPAVVASGLSAEKEKETMMPSPARTPVIHENPFSDRFEAGAPNRHVSGASTLSPPQSPHRLDPRFSRGTLGRSHPSLDGSRGSRFTEDV